MQVNPFAEKTVSQLSKQMQNLNIKAKSSNEMYATAEGFGKLAKPVNQHVQAKVDKENETTSDVCKESSPIGPQKSFEQVQPLKNLACDDSAMEV